MSFYFSDDNYWQGSTKFSEVLDEDVLDFIRGSGYITEAFNYDGFMCAIEVLVNTKEGVVTVPNKLANDTACVHNYRVLVVGKTQVADLVHRDESVDFKEFFEELQELNEEPLVISASIYDEAGKLHTFNYEGLVDLLYSL